jgi:acyl-CoA reductase-like NAD-dependent aldehyde dehydrogenase
MTEHFAIMAPGVRPSGERNVCSPYDDSSVLAGVDTMDAEGVDTALGTAFALFRDRAGWLDGPERAAILEKTAQIMQQRAEELAMGAAAEGGKPLMDSRVEVARAIDGIKLCVDSLRRDTGHEIPMGMTESSRHRLAVTRREPIGVVAAVSAFNHPLNLIVHQVGPAVAAGCPVVVKPASDTPLSCLRFVNILREAGLPEAWCQVAVTANSDAAEKLVTDPRVGFFSFIGSASTGWMLRSKLAPGARCALEHGGVAPVIVAADADLDEAVPLLLKGGFYHAGQVCVSVQRILTDRRIAEDVAARLAAGAEKLRVGDPCDEKTEVGPLIRAREVERVHEWVQEAVGGGGRLLCGGKVLDHNCYAPTVILDPPGDAVISRNEVFGPVVCVYTWDHVEDAIEQANSLDVAFQAAVFSRDIDFAMRCYRGLDGSAVMVNDHTAFRVDWMPFAGLRHSGHGIGGIEHTFREMTIEKMLVIRSRALP